MREISCSLARFSLLLCGMSPFTRIAIIGPGLLGGSIGFACQKECAIRFWGRNPEKLMAVKAAGFDASEDLRKVIDKAELIILAIPITHMGSMARSLIEAGLTPQQIITDVGSVKQSVMEELSPILNTQGFTFIGSHPMAGAEIAGFEAAREDLFVNAPCIITPSGNEHGEALNKIKQWWQQLGMTTHIMSASAHDEVVSRVSHIPHLMAAACAQVSLKDASYGSYAGGGLRDTSRVASGDANLWTGILSENKSAIIPPLEEAIARLEQYRDVLINQDEQSLHTLLTQDKEARDAYYTQT